jgi:CTP:molybdopterin cytidylyltransferase MocA
MTGISPFIAILAAGDGRRFGGAKLDAPCAGKPLGRWAIETALRCSSDIVMIVGDPVPIVATDAFDAGEVDLLRNEGAETGIGTSVACAASAARGAGATRLLVMLADMPLVTPNAVNRVVDAAQGCPAMALYPEGHGGVPACFPLSYYERLASLGGDRGALGLLGDDPSILLVSIPVAQLRDVDRPDDLKEAEDCLMRSRLGDQADPRRP